MPDQPASQLHFDHPTVAWAKIGATIGAVAVLAVAGVLILVTEQSASLLGVAALGAVFGGAGFGAMLGAVLASIRAGENRPAPAAATVRSS